MKKQQSPNQKTKKNKKPKEKQTKLQKQYNKEKINDIILMFKQTNNNPKNFVKFQARIKFYKKRKVRRMRLDIVTTLQGDFEYLRLIKKHGKAGRHMALESLLKRNKDNFFERYLYRLSFEQFQKCNKGKKHKLIKYQPIQKTMKIYMRKNVERLSRPIHQHEMPQYLKTHT